LSIKYYSDKFPKKIQYRFNIRYFDILSKYFIFTIFFIFEIIVSPFKFNKIKNTQIIDIQFNYANIIVVFLPNLVLKCIFYIKMKES
jgi:hypothetical protein